MLTDVETLRGARAFLGHRDHWCQGAMTVAGRACVTGSLYVAQGTIDVFNDDDEGATMVQLDEAIAQATGARDRLDAAARRWLYYHGDDDASGNAPAARANDTYGYDAVLEILDMAIAAAERDLEEIAIDEDDDEAKEIDEDVEVIELV